MRWTYSNIEFRLDEIEELNEIAHGVWIQGKKDRYFGLQAFDSRFDYQKIKAASKYPVLQQHFLGWFVKSDQPVFNSKVPSFMDFSIPQNRNTRFMYVLPFSDREALVEYTLFSENTLERAAYESAIKDYLTHLRVTDYQITEVEQGNIPMTCYDFTQENTNRILKIGMAGGWTKASTGYTFYNSFKKVTQLAEHLKTERPLKKFDKKNRFWYYDLLLLDILHKKNYLGRKLFESLFKKQKPQTIFKFLDEETHFLEELKIIASPPSLPFIKALWRSTFS